MKASTSIGIGVAFAGLAVGALMEGASPAAFLNIPALLIVLGGTFGATFAGTTIEKIKLIPALYKKAMGGDNPEGRSARAARGLRRARPPRGPAGARRGGRRARRRVHPQGPPARGRRHRPR